MPDDSDANQISERVARGFEALVDEESPAVPPPPPPPPPPPSPTASSDNAAVAARIDALEVRVRQTMDRLTELVEAQLPEAVDGLRSDLETLRLELQTSLSDAAQEMGDERRQLRSQIATTVGAANRWFVRARDQINERLDAIADIAADAQSQSELAATAATSAAQAAQAAETAAAAAAAAVAPPPAPPEEPAAEPAAGAEDAQPGLEWEVEEGADRTPVPAPTTQPATVDLAIDAPELDALMYPVRGDLQELQMEVAGLGEAVRDVQAALTRLANRVPARGIKLSPDQLELIVEAVMAALPAPAPPPRAPARKAPAKKAAAAAAAVKAPVTKKKAAPKKAPAVKRPVRPFFE